MDTKESKTGYAEVDDILNKAMRVVQRKLENGKLKVNLLNILVDAKELLDNDGKELSGRRE